jgi:predicted MFS family arabinose efflux permease
VTPDFRRFQAARFLLTIGIQMQSVAVGWNVYELTHRPIDLGYVGLAQFLPLFVLSPITGQVADRYDRRMILLISYAGILLSSLLLLLFTWRGIHHVGVIYAILVLFGATRAFNAPAASALLTHLVPTADFPRAVAWSSTSWQIATVIGPALGGLVYDAAGAAAVYSATAASAIATFVLVGSMSVRTGGLEKGPLSMKTLLAGLRYVAEKKILLGSITLDLFAVLLGGAVALLPIFAKDILHLGPRALGLLRSAPAIGAATMAFTLAHRPLERRAGAIMFSSVGVFGVATVVFALSKVFWLSFLALSVCGASDMVSVIVRRTLILIATPPEMRGRVSAVSQVFIGASNELGEFESGLTAAWWGAVRAAVVGGVATCAVVAVCATVFKDLRRVDRLQP